MAGWVAGTLLLYGLLNGFHRQSTLDIQLHNTYFVLAPPHALLAIALLLAPVAGGCYALLRRRTSRAVAVASGVLALLLIYLLGDASNAVAAAANYSFWLNQSGAMVAPTATTADGSVVRLLAVLRVLQVLFGIVALLAGIALGRRYTR
ncbi:hypothetical protein [Hymenobacter jeollabukensis]|uniref:Uncharacterized protein n=1 Tax=Hymenobacter jeollabukensis TaxID=2025313 RepID=A0A5R8WST4_9BACT|nr:hypothetical protein [Hymenobacter jeollabukensis]TLM93986.1 hypothetical protein FDY95_08105 [Hymenobacter jeollabukensis]